VDVLVSRLLITLRAVIYMTGFVLLWGWVAIRVHAFDRGLGVPLPLATRILGVIFMGLGGILAVTCAGVFVAQGRGTPAPFDAPRNFRRRRSLSVRSESDVHRSAHCAGRFWSVRVFCLNPAPVFSRLCSRPSVRRRLRGAGAEGKVRSNLQPVLCWRTEMDSSPTALMDIHRAAMPVRVREVRAVKPEATVSLQCWP